MSDRPLRSRRSDRRRRRGRRGDRARALALRAALHPARGGPRRRRRDEQGQHRPPAHRLRRQAGHARVAPRAPRATSCSASTRRSAGIPIEPTGALLVAWDAAAEAALAGIVENARGATATAAIAPARARGALRARAAPRARCARRRSRFPTRASSVRSRPRSPTRPRRSRTARAAARASPLDRRRAATDGGYVLATIRRAAARRARSSTPPGCTPTRSTACFGHDALHGHPAARRADRLRQARPPARRHVILAGADEDDQGRAGRADGLRQRRARTDRRGRRRPSRPPRRPRPGWRACRHEGGGSCRRCSSEEVTAVYVGPARRDRARRLPDQRRRRAALRLRRRHPLDRAHRPRWRSPSTCVDGLARRPGCARSRRRTSASMRMPNIGESVPRPYADRRS